MCVGLLDVTLPQGKTLINELINGCTIPSDLMANETAIAISRLGVWLRWIAVSAIPDVFDQLQKDETCNWPMGSTFAYFYQGVESYILEKWLEFVLRYEHQHLSLHYDGIRIDNHSVQHAMKERMPPMSLPPQAMEDAFIEECKDFIQKETCIMWI